MNSLTDCSHRGMPRTSSYPQCIRRLTQVVNQTCYENEQATSSGVASDREASPPPVSEAETMAQRDARGRVASRRGGPLAHGAHAHWHTGMPTAHCGESHPRGNPPALQVRDLRAQADYALFQSETGRRSTTWSLHDVTDEHKGERRAAARSSPPPSAIHKILTTARSAFTSQLSVLPN